MTGPQGVEEATVNRRVCLPRLGLCSMPTCVCVCVFVGVGESKRRDATPSAFSSKSVSTK